MAQPEAASDDRSAEGREGLNRSRQASDDRSAEGREGLNRPRQASDDRSAEGRGGLNRSRQTPLLEARAVTRQLPEGAILVSDINLRFAPGEFVAITGPSGSGKSSLLYLLGLLDRPSSGAVLLEGTDTARLTAAQLAALRLRRLGFVFQFHFLLEEFSALDNVTMPMRALGKLGLAEMRARAHDILASLGLADQTHKRPDQLSGGQRQRVAVARALANDPPVILADEPTGSLDSKSSEQVFQILKSLVEDTGKTVVAVTHDLAIAARCERRIHLVDGAIVSDERQLRAAP